MQLFQCNGLMTKCQGLEGVKKQNSNFCLFQQLFGVQGSLIYYRMCVKSRVSRLSSTANKMST